jgi:BolA family transcriptional regulator, general stress-responsive regulator
MSDTTDLIRQKLAALEPAKIDIIDDSARHAGHAGARGGGGHYSVIIVSWQFSGKTAVARHRLVYSALGDLMHKDIHALSVKAYTPEESDLIH